MVCRAWRKRTPSAPISVALSSLCIPGMYNGAAVSACITHQIMFRARRANLQHAVSIACV